MKSQWIWAGIRTPGSRSRANRCCENLKEIGKPVLVAAVIQGLGGNGKGAVTEMESIGFASRGHENTLRERSFQLTQDPVRFAQSKLHDLIGARLRIAVGIDAQLMRVARQADVCAVAICRNGRARHRAH